MGSIESDVRTRARRVAIVGAGASGLAAAKYLTAEQAFDEIVVFEQRNDVGGLWMHSICPQSILAGLRVPQTDPNQDAESTIDDGSTFLSPVYDRLETNIPRGLMGFSDIDWPSDCQLFPSHESVLEYIRRYGMDVQHLIRFSTQVLDVSRSFEETWMVKTRNVQHPDQTEMHTYDAVIVASGHFRVEYIPEVKGLEEWHRRHPVSISHSKYYRKPEDFANKKVLVIGNSASGIDIGSQIRQVCKKPLIQSSRSQSYLQVQPPPNQTEKPEIQEMRPESRTVVFVDGSEEAEVDEIVFCTGYLYSFPFLTSLNPPVISTGERVQQLYKHIFYRPHPTLSFMVLNQKIIPFPTAEAQAAVIARFLSGRLALPPHSAMQAWEDDLIKQTARLRDFHVLKFPSDFHYINELHDWASRADREHVQKGESAKTQYKEPPRWTELEYWTRERFPAIKAAFQSLGDARHTKRSLIDVGFDHDAWKLEQTSNE